MNYLLNAELLKISQQLENRRQINQKLQDTKRIWSVEQKKLENAKQKMNDEFQDVKDLENITLKSIWYDLLNKKFTELEREQAEYYKAKMQFESQQNKFNCLTFEIKSYEAQLIDFQTIKVQYEGLVQEKIKFLQEKKYYLITDIFEKQDILVKIGVYINEIQEALLATENTLKIIPEVIEDLKTAKSYATWDMVGGGAGATFLKRQKMKKAKLGIIEINYVLDKLKREMKDLKADLLPTEIRFNTSWEFADYFFDNLFVDMQIRTRIVEAYNAILSLYNSLMVLKENLILEKSKQKNLYQEHEEVFREIIEQI